MFKKLNSLSRYIKTFKNWRIPAFARYGIGRGIPERMLEFRDGRKIAFRPTSDHVALGEIFIAGGYDICGQVSGEAKVIWDIGGNIGAFVVWASKHFPNATYFSFEPCADTFHVLERTRLGNPAIKWNTCNFGLSSKNETVVAHIPQGHYGEASRYADSGKQVEFPLRSINEAWTEAGKPHIDLLKIDCEGGEYEILRGVSEELLSNIGAIVMEVHTIPGEDSAKIRKRLHDARFSVSWFDGPQGVAFAAR